MMVIIRCYQRKYVFHFFPPCQIYAYSDITLKVVCFKDTLFKDCQWVFESACEPTNLSRSIHELNITHVEYLEKLRHCQI